MEEDRWIKEPDKKDNKNHSKFIVVVVLIGVAIAALIALLHGEPKVEVLTLDKTNVSLGIDETDRLTVTVKPEKAQPVLVWNSSDENIVTVTDGVVIARKAGNAVVKVSVKDQQDLYAVCEYTVLDPDVDMQTLDILEEPIVLRPGGHQQLTVKITPENQNEMILWSSSNESVARVSPRGKVEAIKVGYAKIIATSERTGVADTATVSVEGSGIPTTNSAPEAAQKPTQAATPDPAPTKTPKPAPATMSKPVPAATPKSAPATASKSAPVKTSKPVQTTVKPSQTTTSKPSQATTSKPAPTTTAKPVTTTKPVQTIVKNTSGVKDFGYATFKGTWPNDVKGRMEFKSTHVIDSRDPKNRMASPGDYVVGEWSEGHLVQGVWYGSDGKAKGSILLGK